MAPGRRLLVVVLAAALLASACASSGRPARKFTLFEEDYASWAHLKFSVTMTLQRLVGRQPMATPEDAKTAQAQGGWWGAEIPVKPGP